MSSGNGWLWISFFIGSFVNESILGGDAYFGVSLKKMFILVCGAHMGVSGRVGLDVVCRGVFMVFIFGCSAYTAMLVCII